MERGLPEAPAQFRPRAGIQQLEPYFLRSQARGPDQRRVLPFLLKIEVRPPPGSALRRAPVPCLFAARR